MFNRFSPIKNIKSNPQSGQLDLHDILNNSYSYILLVMYHSNNQ